MNDISKKGIVKTGGTINPNLILNSYIMQLGTSNPTTGTWRLSGTSDMTRTRVLIGNGMYGFQNSGIQTSNDGSCYCIDSFPTYASSTYTMSFYARLISGTGGNAGFVIYDATVINGSHTGLDKGYYVTPLSKEWTRCWVTVTTLTNTTRNLYIGVTTGDTSVTTQMCMVKLESGSKLTPWCPNSSDDIYISNNGGLIETLHYDVASISNNEITSNQFYEF